MTALTWRQRYAMYVATAYWSSHAWGHDRRHCGMCQDQARGRVEWALADYDRHLARGTGAKR